jgi:hypothetical protein
LFPLIIAWLAFLVSMAFPPLLLLTGPLLFWVVRREVRIRNYQRRATRRALETRNIMAVGRAFSSTK